MVAESVQYCFFFRFVTQLQIYSSPMLLERFGRWRSSLQLVHWKKVCLTVVEGNEVSIMFTVFLQTPLYLAEVYQLCLCNSCKWQNRTYKYNKHSYLLQKCVVVVSLSILINICTISSARY